MNDYDLIPPSNRRLLIDAYREASQRANKTFDALEKVCVENCLIKIQIALSNHSGSEKTVKVYVFCSVKVVVAAAFAVFAVFPGFSVFTVFTVFPGFSLA